MKEIFRLKEMLESENIPFEFIEYGDIKGYQITYPTIQFDISVVQHRFSYGNHLNLLEMMDISKPNVEGYLSAEDALERIKNHYKVGEIDDTSSGNQI